MKWYIVLIGVLVLGLIAGGIYMNKTRTQELLQEEREGVVKASGENEGEFLIAETQPEPALIVETQSMLDSYFAFYFSKLNNNNDTWFVNFTIDPLFYNDAKGCVGKGINNPCWDVFFNRYFNSSEYEGYTKQQLKLQIENITNYPREALSQGLVFDNFNFNQTSGSGSFSLFFNNGFEIGKRMKLGFNSTNITSAFLDGTASGTISTTCSSPTTIGTLSTTFPAGTNLIIAQIHIASTDAGAEVINNGDLRLIRNSDGGNVSMNFGDGMYITGIKLNINPTSVSYLILANDTSGALNERYNITACSSATAVTIEAKMLALSNVEQYVLRNIITDGNDINITTDFGLNGTNIVLGFAQINTGAGGETSVNMTLKGNNNVLMSWRNISYFAGTGSTDTNGFGFVYLDNNTNDKYYNITIRHCQTIDTSSCGIPSGISGSIMVIRVKSAYSNNVSSVSVGTTSGGSHLMGLSTDFASGSSIGIIAQNVFLDVDAGSENIAVGNTKLNQSGLTVSSIGVVTAPFSITNYATYSGLIKVNTSTGSKPFYNVTAFTSATQWNYTGQIVAFELANQDTTDTTPPQWSSNSTNSTLAGTLINHTVLWTDSALSNYTFSFDNGTGTFVNDSVVTMNGTSNQSWSVQKVNQTVGSYMRWQVWAWDITGNSNGTMIFGYNTTSAPSTCWTYTVATKYLQIPTGCLYTGNLTP